MVAAPVPLSQREAGIPAKAQCIVLCGGLGTRVAEIAGGCPKAMLPVGGAPFLELLIRQLKSWGVEDVVLCTGVGSSIIAKWSGRRSESAPRIQILEDEEVRGTWPPIRRAMEGFALDEVLICNGDTLLCGDFRAITDKGLQPPEELCRLGITPVADTADFGRVIEEQGKLRSLERGVRGPGPASNGLIRMRREIVRYATPFTTSLDDLIVAAAADFKVTVVEAGDQFVDIGTPGRYEALCGTG